MAKRALSTLKSFFLTGLYPTQNQFHDWLDSFFHKDDKIEISSINKLSEILNDKLERSLIDFKQDKNDEELNTESKTIVSAINELLDGKLQADATLAGLLLSENISSERLVTELGLENKLPYHELSTSDFHAMNAIFKGESGAFAALVTDESTNQKAFVFVQYRKETPATTHFALYGKIDVEMYSLKVSDTFNFIEGLQNSSSPVWTKRDFFVPISRTVAGLNLENNISKQSLRAALDFDKQRTFVNVQSPYEIDLSKDVHVINDVYGSPMPITVPLKFINASEAIDEIEIFIRTQYGGTKTVFFPTVTEVNPQNPTALIMPILSSMFFANSLPVIAGKNYYFKYKHVKHPRFNSQGEYDHLLILNNAAHNE